MKKQLTILLFLTLTIMQAQKKKPIQFGLSYSVSGFNQKGIIFQRLEINPYTVAYVNKKSPYYHYMYSAYFVAQKPINKRLSLGTQLGFTIIFKDPITLEYREKENITSLRALLTATYGFGTKHQLIKPYVTAKFGYVNLYYHENVTSEITFDHHGGIAYELEASFKIQNRKLKRLAPFRFFVSFNRYYENARFDIDYVLPSTPDVHFDYRVLRESMSMGVAYFFTRKPKKKTFKRSQIE